MTQFTVGLPEVLRVEPEVWAAELVGVGLLSGDQPAAEHDRKGEDLMGGRERERERGGGEGVDWA